MTVLSSLPLTMADRIPSPPPYFTTSESNASGSSALESETLPEYVAPSTARQGLSGSGPRAAETKEFEYKIEQRGKRIAVMTVVAVAAYSKNIPTFVGGGPVKGAVCLNLEKPEAIQAVTVSIRGRFLSGLDTEEEEVVFLRVSQILWSSDSATQIQHPLVNSKGKLQGNHIWNFSLDIPKEVSMPSPSTRHRSAVENFVPPQTFSERALRGCIKYEVSLKVARGKLRTDHRISVPFGFIPLVRPPPFPPLRQLSYREGTPLMDPTIDLDGWHSSDQVQILGTLFKSRTVAIKATLFIAKPLAYTRGAVIPLYLRLQSDDQQAADLLSSSNAIVVRLRRTVKYNVPFKNLKNAENFHIAQGKNVQDCVEAVWWPSIAQGTPSNVDVSENVRCINGELHLRSDLQPSSSMPVFRIEYSVVLCSFNIAGFEMATTDKVLLEQPADIVTSFAPGPRAVRSAPPGYDAERQTPVDAPGLSFLSSSGFI